MRLRVLQDDDAGRKNRGVRREGGSATFVCELRDTGWDETLSLLEPLLEAADGWQRLTWGGPANWIASAGEQR